MSPRTGVRARRSRRRASGLICSIFTVSSVSAVSVWDAGRRRQTIACLPGYQRTFSGSTDDPVYRLHSKRQEGATITAGAESGPTQPGGGDSFAPAIHWDGTCRSTKVALASNRPECGSGRRLSIATSSPKCGCSYALSYRLIGFNSNFSRSTDPIVEDRVQISQQARLGSIPVRPNLGVVVDASSLGEISPIPGSSYPGGRLSLYLTFESHLREHGTGWALPPSGAKSNITQVLAGAPYDHRSLSPARGQLQPGGSPQPVRPNSPAAEPSPLTSIPARPAVKNNHRRSRGPAFTEADAPSPVKCVGDRFSRRAASPSTSTPMARSVASDDAGATVRH